VIQGNFHRSISAEAIGSSGHHSDFIVQALDGPERVKNAGEQRKQWRNCLRSREKMGVVSLKRHRNTPCASEQPNTDWKKDLQNCGTGRILRKTTKKVHAGRGSKTIWEMSAREEPRI